MKNEAYNDLLSGSFTSDGAVRSGLFAAAMYVIDMMKVEQVVDVFLACRFVAINRPQVVSSMVRTLTSYFIKHVVSLCLNIR